MPHPIITFTTDFGEGSPYVAQMKAVALSMNPELTLIDITHAIRPQDIRHGAIVLADTARRFPPGTVHVCVVDPGVGTERKIVYARFGVQQFIAPDNGLLSLVERQQPADELICLDAPEYWRPEVSATFHGRDIMASVAAHVTLGVESRQLGARHAGLTQIAWPEVDCQERSLRGSVVLVDGFGNLITNIMRDTLPRDVPRADMRVACGTHVCRDLVATYGDASPGDTIALFGSSDRLEIAVTNGNAAQTLGCATGDTVEVTW